MWAYALGGNQGMCCYHDEQEGQHRKIVIGIFDFKGSSISWRLKNFLKKWFVFQRMFWMKAHGLWVMSRLPPVGPTACAAGAWLALSPWDNEQLAGTFHFVLENWNNEGNRGILSWKNSCLWCCSSYCGHLLRSHLIREALRVWPHPLGNRRPPPSGDQLLLHCDCISTVSIPAMASSLRFHHHASSSGWLWWQT